MKQREQYFEPYGNTTVSGLPWHEHV